MFHLNVFQPIANMEIVCISHWKRARDRRRGKKHIKKVNNWCNSKKRCFPFFTHCLRQCGTCVSQIFMSNCIFEASTENVPEFRHRKMTFTLLGILSYSFFHRSSTFLSVSVSLVALTIYFMFLKLLTSFISFRSISFTIVSKSAINWLLFFSCTPNTNTDDKVE